MKQGLAEVLQEVSSKETKKERIELLKQHTNNRPLQIVLIYALNPHIEWLLPPGEPPYKPADKGEDLQGSLIGQVRKLSIFIRRGGYDHMKDERRQQLFIQFLESLDPDDAKLIAAAKDKKVPYKGITKDTLEKAWPGFTSTWEEKKDESKSDG